MPSETREGLTEAETREAFDATHDERPGAAFSYRQWEDLPADQRVSVIAFAHRIYALAQSRASERIDAAALKLEGAREALTKFGDAQDDSRTSGRQVAAQAEAFRDREYPAPRPAPKSVTLSDGSVVAVTLLGNGFQRSTEFRAYDVVPKGNWRLLLNRPTDTGADFDALKAFALALSEAP